MTEPHRLSHLTSKSIRPILAVISIAMTALLGILLMTLQQENKRHRSELGENFTWHITQVEREGLMFLDAVQSYRYSPNPAIIDRVILRFDIFWSRAYALDQGDVGKFFLSLEGGRDAVGRLKENLQVTSSLVSNLVEQPQLNSSEIIERTQASLLETHMMANQTTAYFQKQKENRRKRFQQLYVQALTLLAGAVLAVAILIALFLKQQKLLDQLNTALSQRVETQSVDLRNTRQKVLLLSRAVEQSPAAIIIFNVNGIIEYVNDRFEVNSGYSAEDVVGRSMDMLRSDQTPEKTYEAIWEALRSGREWRGEICSRKKNNDPYWEQVSITRIIDEDNSDVHYLAVQEDVTQRKMYERKLLHMASFDSLTKLPNRSLVMDRLEQAMLRAKRNGEQVGLLFIDLDNFKEINDTLGHAAGDAILEKTASKLEGCLRSCDTAGRLGGDEFIVILSELQEKKNALQVLDRIIETFSQPFVVQDNKVMVTPSIGVSFFPDDGQDSSLLLQNADTAMYRAKDAGKSCYKLFGDLNIES